MLKTKHKANCNCGCQSKKKHPPACSCKDCRTEEIYEGFFSSSFSVIRRIYSALSKGYWSTAVRLSIQRGQGDPDRLTDMIFFAKHPELPRNYKIRRDQRNLINEWISIKNNIVLPQLNQSYGGYAPSTGSCKVHNLLSKAKPYTRSDVQAGRRRYTSISSSRPRRKLSQITGVVLHQMAFSRGNDLNRYLRVPVHYIIMPDGKIGQLYPHEYNMNASNGFNFNTVAIEFAGNFPNTRGRCWNAAKMGCHTPTTAQIKAGRCLLKKLMGDLPNMKYVYAHRQSSRNKSNDPGPKIWKDVGEYAIKHLGYSSSSRSVVKGSGQTIPSSWR